MATDPKPRTLKPIKLTKRHFEDAEGVCMWCAPGSDHGPAQDCPASTRLTKALDAFTGELARFSEGASRAAQSVGRLREALERDPRFVVRENAEGRLHVELAPERGNRKSVAETGECQTAQPEDGAGGEVGTEKAQ